jgi:hypothetical protein
MCERGEAGKGGRGRRLDVNALQLGEQSTLVEYCRVVDGKGGSAGRAERRKDLSAARRPLDFDAASDGWPALDRRRLGQASLNRRDERRTASALDRVNPRQACSVRLTIPPAESLIRADDERAATGWNDQVTR